MYSHSGESYQCTFCPGAVSIYGESAMRAHLIAWHNCHHPTRAFMESMCVRSQSSTDHSIRLDSNSFVDVVGGLLDNMSRNVQQGIRDGMGNTMNATSVLFGLMERTHSKPVSPVVHYHPSTTMVPKEPPKLSHKRTLPLMPVIELSDSSDSDHTPGIQHVFNMY